MAAKQITEAQMVQLVRNALLVAGHEMGETGDHWPVVNSTIHSVMQDWEQLQIERNVETELKTHLAAWLKDLEIEIAKCPAEGRGEMEKGLQELREVYSAYFETAAPGPLYIEEQDIPAHVKRAKAIVSALEEDK